MCKIRIFLRNRSAKQPLDFSHGNLLKRGRGRNRPTGRSTELDSTAMIFLTGRFTTWEKSRNWLLAREIATKIRLDDPRHAEFLGESLENARFPSFFRRYWTYRSGSRQIEKGRRKGGS